MTITVFRHQIHHNSWLITQRSKPAWMSEATSVDGKKSVSRQLSRSCSQHEGRFTEISKQWATSWRCKRRRSCSSGLWLILSFWSRLFIEINDWLVICYVHQETCFMLVLDGLGENGVHGVQDSKQTLILSFCLMTHTGRLLVATVDLDTHWVHLKQTHLTRALRISLNDVLLELFDPHARWKLVENLLCFYRTRESSTAWCQQSMKASSRQDIRERSWRWEKLPKLQSSGFIQATIAILNRRVNVLPCLDVVIAPESSRYGCLGHGAVPFTTSFTVRFTFM